MTERQRSGFEELAKGSKLYPQESLLQTKKQPISLFIGIPKEISFQENRLAITPDGVNLLVNNGHEIWVETGAGKESKFTDKEFSDAGAKIVYSNEEVFKADIILKVEPPTLEEITMMTPGKVLISALQLGNQSPAFLKSINQKKLTALAYEFIEDKVGGMPAIRAMSVAEYAARTALGLGVDIRIFDNHIYKLRRLKHALGQQVYTSTLNNVLLIDALKQADVVIGAIRAEKGRTRCIITEDMVSQMKPGSIIIDVSIDQGGCIETSEITTHDNPVFTKLRMIFCRKLI